MGRQKNRPRTAPRPQDDNKIPALSSRGDFFEDTHGFLRDVAATIGTEAEQKISVLAHAVHERLNDELRAFPGYSPVNGLWAVLAKPDGAIPPLSEGTRQFSAVIEGSIAEESTVNCSELVPSEPESISTMVSIRTGFLVGTPQKPNGIQKRRIGNQQSM
jgi:hypothetical protein